MSAILYRPRLAAVLAFMILVLTCLVTNVVLLAGAAAESESADRTLARAVSMEPITAVDASAQFRVSLEGRESVEDIPLNLVMGLRPPLPFAQGSVAPAPLPPTQAPPSPMAQIPAGYSAQVWVEPDLEPTAAPHSRMLTLLTSIGAGLLTAGSLTFLSLRVHRRFTRHLHAPDYVPLEWLDVHSDR